MAFTASHCRNLTGSTIANETILFVDLLACGASGAVYRAVDLTSPDCDQYAVKCMSKAIYDGSLTHHLRHEIILHQRVSKHPHILTMHNVYEDESFVYIVLDLIRSGDLRKSISERRAPYYGNDEIVKRVFGQIVDAVEFCHKKGLYHRDLKPDNILTSEDGRSIWLADFGLATVDKKCKEFRTGTLPYLSPECLSEALSPLSGFSPRQSDIWAVGIILINIIAQANPWTIAHDEDHSFSAYLRDPDYLRRRLPISTEANDLLKRILHPDPYKRLSLLKIRAEITKIHTFFMSLDEIECGTPQVKAWHDKMTMKMCRDGSQGAVNVQVLDSPADSQYSVELQSSSSKSSIESLHQEFILRTPRFHSQSTDETSMDSEQEFKTAGLVPRVDLHALEGAKVDFKLEMLMQDILDGLDDFEKESVYEDEFGQC